MLEITFQVAKLHPPYFEGPHFRQNDLPIAVHEQRVLGIDTAPQRQREAIAWSNNVIRADRNVGHGANVVTGLLKTS